MNLSQRTMEKINSIRYVPILGSPAYLVWYWSSTFIYILENRFPVALNTPSNVFYWTKHLHKLMFISELSLLPLLMTLSISIFLEHLQYVLKRNVPIILSTQTTEHLRLVYAILRNKGFPSRMNTHWATMNRNATCW